MRAMEATVRELLAAAQAERKVRLDAGRVDTVFKVGDRVLLRTKELLDAADIGKLRPRWDGPFTVAACPSPNAYTLALPRKMHCSPTVNVDRLKPFHERVDEPPAPGPVSDAGQEGEHEVELLLNRKTQRGVTRYLVRWRGHTSAADEWLRVEELAHCPEKVAEYDAGPGARPGPGGAAVPPPDPAPAPVVLAPLLAPAGFRLALAAEVRSGAPLVGTWVLYRWPVEGWVLGRVRRVCRRGGFSHVVGYTSSSPHGAAVVDTLLDVASHGPGGRWHLLVPTGRPSGPGSRSRRG
jgi:hypothetical protein